MLPLIVLSFTYVLLMISTHGSAFVTNIGRIRAKESSHGYKSSELFDFKRPKSKIKVTKRTPRPKVNSEKGGGKHGGNNHPVKRHSDKDNNPPPFGVGIVVANQPPPKAKTKSMNILGQNVVQCRDFSITSAKTADFVGSYPSVDQMPIFSIPELAFLGRSNVGKSSLFNSLIGAKVAVSSKTPGRTQSINTFICKDKGGDISIMVDLPGYGYAKLSKEKQEGISNFIQDYLLDRKSLRLVVLLVDCRREVQEYERSVLHFLRKEGLQYVVVATKIDKMKKNEAITAIQAYKRQLGLADDQMLGFSAITGEGRKLIWTKIRDGLIGAVSKAFDDDMDGDGTEGDEEGDYGENDDEPGWG